MKCKKCGKELGQKNICPVCGKDKTTDDPVAPELVPCQVPCSGFSKEELSKIDEFLKAHPSDWNDEFDEFYDQQFSAAVAIVLMPQKGVSDESAVLAQWLVKEGDTVKKDQNIFVQETGKASFECESPADGIVQKIFVQEGEEVNIGTPVAVIGLSAAESSKSNYRDTVSMCRHRAEIFAAIRAMLKDAQKLSADLMIRIMDEIPKKYPEIEENEARALAKEFFGGRKQIRQLTLKNTASCPVLGGIVDRLVIGQSLCLYENIALSWKRKKNDRVNDGDELCVLKSGRLMRFIQENGMTPTVTISKEECVECGCCIDSCPVGAIVLNGEGAEIKKSDCVECGSCVGVCPVEAISRNAPSIAPTVKSPWNGRIVSIRTEPVTKLDDIICEIETQD